MKLKINIFDFKREYTMARKDIRAGIADGRMKDLQYTITVRWWIWGKVIK